MDLEEVKRSAVHRDIRRRGQRCPKSPQRRRRAQLKVFKDELLEKALALPSFKGSSITTCPRELLGEQSLQNIHNQKSSLAELRPTRRKIKWSSQLTDWQRNEGNNTSISELQLDDLEIHGVRQEQANDKSGMILNDPGKHIPELQRGIRHCFKTIQRVQKETTKIKYEADKVEQENQALRRQILSMSIPRPLQTTVQIHEQLQDKLALLNEQIGMLQAKKKSLQADVKTLHEILENNSKTLHSSSSSSSSSSASLMEKRRVGIGAPAC